MLLREENEKQLKKMQDKWDREESARIELLKDVYANREQALRYQKELTLAEQREKDVEKEQVRKQVIAYAEEEKRKELEEIMKNKSHQNEVLWQINDKAERKREALLKDMEAERQRRLTELNYDRRIKDEEARGKELIMGAKYSRYY